MWGASKRDIAAATGLRVPGHLSRAAAKALSGSAAFFRRSADGTAAVEFALVAPVLATMVVGITQISDILIGSAHMQTAARAGIQYALNGGTDMTVVQNLGLQAWSGKPANATLAASEYCTCSGVTSVCTQTCADGSVPQQFIAVTASGHLGGTVYDVDKTVTETARIR